MIFTLDFVQLSRWSSYGIFLCEIDYRCTTDMTGHPPHFTTNVMQYLNEQFSDLWIGHGGPQD